MPSHMIGFIPTEIGVPWHLGLHSSHRAATQTNKTMLFNFKFLCQSHMLHWIPNSDAEELIKFQRIMVYQADMRGECCAFQASDNNAEVKAIVNSKHDTFENTELRGDPSITHRRITEVRVDLGFQASRIWEFTNKVSAKDEAKAYITLPPWHQSWSKKQQHNKLKNTIFVIILHSSRPQSIQWQIQTKRCTLWIHNWKPDFCNQNRTICKGILANLDKDLAVWLILMQSILRS
jgi:hypothetical protein